MKNVYHSLCKGHNGFALEVNLPKLYNLRKCVLHSSKSAFNYEKDTVAFIVF